MGLLQRAAEAIEDALDWDDGDELPAWDPAECSCHINPPCGYCEGGEYTL